MNAFEIPQWASFVVSIFSLVGIVYTGIKSRKTALETAELNAQFATRLKTVEHQLAYRATLLARRAKVYEELNELVGMFFTGLAQPGEQDESRRPYSNRKQDYVLKLEAFSQNTLYLNKPARLLLEKFTQEAFLYSIDKSDAMAVRHANLYRLGRSIQRHVIQDLRTLYDLDLWEVDDLVEQKHLSEPPPSDQHPEHKGRPEQENAAKQEVDRLLLKAHADEMRRELEHLRSEAGSAQPKEDDDGTIQKRV